MAKPRTVVRYIQAEKEHIALLNKLLADSAKEVQKQILANAAKTGVSATLTNIQLRAQLSSILAYQKNIWDGVEGIVRKGRADAAAAASRVVSEYENDLLKLVLDKDNLKILSDAEALRAAAGVENTVARILSSERPLSATVYGAANIANRQVSNLVNKGLIQGWNARQLAKEVRQFIDPAVPGGVSYSARRLARTEINNAFHATAQDRYKKDGIVDLVDWKISGSHPRPDECDSLEEEGPYPVDEVPEKPHPQCLCVIEPHLPDPDEFLRKMFNGDYGDAPWNPEDRVGGFKVNLDVDMSGLRKTGASATATQAPKTPKTPKLDAIPRGPAATSYGIVADQRLVNPHRYDIASDGNTNPYAINCSRVATATELRLRGYLVEAGPKNLSIKDNQMNVIARMWRRADTGGLRKFTQAKTAKSAEAVMKKAPVGSRFFVAGAWKNGGAHIWNAEVKEIGGKKVIEHFEGQVLGSNPAAYMSRLDPKYTVEVLRVDDMIPTDRLMGPTKSGYAVQNQWIYPQGSSPSSAAASAQTPKYPDIR